MSTSSPLTTPDLPRQKHKYEPIIATPQTSQVLSKSHRLLRPIKSKLVSIQHFHELNPSLTRVESIWNTSIWPPNTKTRERSYGGRRKRTRTGNALVEDEQQKSVVETAEFTELDAIKFARNTTTNVTLLKMYENLFVSYRTFLQQIKSGCNGCKLSDIATYTLGTWTYLYEKQSTAQNSQTTSDQPALTLDDVLLEYLPPTHPHQLLLLGYTIALFNDYPAFIRPFLPSLILLTNSFSRRATLELLYILFSVAESGWEDFLLCMTISRMIGYEDEYLKWLSEHVTVQFVEHGGLGHLLRLGRNYPSLAATVVRTIQLAIPPSCKSVAPELESILTDLIQLICSHALQSQSTNHLHYLASVLPTKHALLPSLTLLIHLTLFSLNQNHPTDPLNSLTNRQLNFSLLRQTFPPSSLKSLLTTLLPDPALQHLTISIARDWKDHIDYDDEGDDDHMESTAEFLDRIEREYLTATEGVRWRFEDVLAEWVGEWPDGRELWSSKIPRRKNVIVEEEVDEEDDGGEWGGSMVKREVVRSGLILDTPLPKDEKEYNKNSVMNRLFKLAGLGSTARTERKRGVRDYEEDFSPVVQRSNRDERMDVQKQGPVPKRQTTPQRSRKRLTLVEFSSEEDDELAIYKDVKPNLQKTKRKKRRFGQSDSGSDTSLYEERNTENIVDILLDPEDEILSSDIDELSISYNPPKAHHKLRRSSSRHSLASITNKMLVRESSPIIMEDGSDDELAI